MKTLEAIKFGSDLLKEKKIPSYILDSELLLSKTLNKSREKILTNLDTDIEKKNFNIFKEYIVRRSKNEPIAYILGEKEFWSKNFIVNKDHNHIGTIILTIAYITKTFQWTSLLTSEDLIYTFPNQITGYTGTLKDSNPNNISLIFDTGNGLHINTSNNELSSKQVFYLGWKQNQDIDALFNSIDVNTLICDSTSNIITIPNFTPSSYNIDLIFKIKLIAPDEVVMTNYIEFTIDSSNILFNIYQSPTETPIQLFYLWDNDFDRDPVTSANSSIIEWDRDHFRDYNIGSHSYLNSDGLVDLFIESKNYSVLNNFDTTLYNVPNTNIQYKLPSTRYNLDWYQHERILYLAPNFITDTNYSSQPGMWHTTATSSSDGESSINYLIMFQCNHNDNFPGVQNMGTHSWGWLFFRGHGPSLRIERATKAYWGTEDQTNGVSISDWVYGDTADKTKQFSFYIGTLGNGSRRACYFNAAEVPFEHGYVYMIEIRLLTNVDHLTGKHNAHTLETGVRYWNGSAWTKTITKKCAYVENNLIENKFTLGRSVGYPVGGYIPRITWMAHLITDHNWSINRKNIYDYLTKRYIDELLTSNLLSW